MLMPDTSPVSRTCTAFRASAGPRPAPALARRPAALWLGGLLCLTAAVLFLARPAAAATPAAVVSGVQMPAWVESANGTRTPLAPGMELKAGEQVRTGAQARLLLRLAEGSQVKLGENGLLRIDELRPDQGGAFRAAMRVAEGAFRFTTDALAKHRRRDVNVLVSNITIGIRGTDLWGKSDPDRQLVCLIEGKIEVAPPGEAALNLDTPLQFYVREKGKSQPVAKVDPAQLAQWALETEIAPGTGAARAGGRWKVTLASADNQQDALALYDRVRNAGYAAQIRPVKAGEALAYEVRISQLPSKAEAEVLAARMKTAMGVAEPKVSQ